MVYGSMAAWCVGVWWEHGVWRVGGEMVAAAAAAVVAAVVVVAGCAGWGASGRTCCCVACRCQPQRARLLWRPQRARLLWRGNVRYAPERWTFQVVVAATVPSSAVLVMVVLQAGRQAGRRAGWLAGGRMPKSSASSVLRSGGGGQTGRHPVAALRRGPWAPHAALPAEGAGLYAVATGQKKVALKPRHRRHWSLELAAGLVEAWGWAGRK